MKFQIKCENKEKIIDVWNIMHSHIINSPDDQNKNDCIIYFDKNNSYIGIYELNFDTFLNDIVTDNTIVFNNSTTIIALDFISDGIGQFQNIGNNTFQLDY